MRLEKRSTFRLRYLTITHLSMIMPPKASKFISKTFASIPMAILSFSSSPVKDTNPVLKITLVLGHFYNGLAMIGTSAPSPLPTATTTWDRSISKLMVPIALLHLRKPVLRHITLVAKWPCGKATTMVIPGTVSNNSLKTVNAITLMPAVPLTLIPTSMPSGQTAMRDRHPSPVSTSATNKAMSTNCLKKWTATSQNQC